ncbi:MAG: ABC transporter permease [Cyclobacteriaceae bacterium]|nr:ABC transporter permease [Cyclobacteriaceae bacterium]
MNKIWLIIQREFLSRVKKKSFLIATLLVPLLFPTIIGGMIYFAMEQEKNAEQRTIQLLNNSAFLKFEDSSKYKYISVEGDVDLAKKAFNESDDFAFVYIPEIDLENPEGINFYSKSSPGITLISEFERNIERQIRDVKLLNSGLSQEVLDKLKTNVDINSFNIQDGEEKKSSSELISGIGYIMGMLIYIFLFVYGAQVMQGVIEEKNSKIIEVIVSTVKPFHLMMGKVIGVASVGLFQFLIWILLSTGISMGAAAYFGVSSGQQVMMTQAMNELPQEQQMNMKDINPDVQEVFNTISDIPILKITLLFIFYFLGGYLLYGALFAAIGSAVDTPADAQQFMFPIMLPIIIGLMGLFMFVFKDPNGAVSFWLSVIPFTSPIVMMGRVGFGVPAWEIALSMVLLVAGFVFTIWLAGRIYRVGILMHGTKVNYKVLAKWFMMKH